MFAVDVCRLPATGGSIFVLVVGLFLLAAGAIVTRWVRQSAGRLSVVVGPLVLLGGLALTPQMTDPCMPPTTATPTTTVAPDATASPTTTVAPDAAASPTTTVAPDSTASPTTTAVPESVFSNDDVVHAYNMSTAETGTWTGDTTLATVEGESEPFYDGCSYDADGCDGPYNTVWFKWVATTDGSLVVDSCDTSFDSVLSVYSISDIEDPWNSDILIDEDDESAPNSCGGVNPARITVAVSAGDSYYIQLDGYDANGFGPAQLNWQFTVGVRPTNDDVVDAFELTVSGSWTGDTTLATVEGGSEPFYDDCSDADDDGCEGPYATVWFKWVATTDGSLIVDSCDTSFDSVLSVYSISNILDPWNNDVFIDEDDSSAPDSCGGDDPARLTVAVSVGDTYYIQLDGYDEDGFGPAQLNWQFFDPNDDVVDAFELTGSGSWTGDTTFATVEVGEPGEGPYATVWFKWVATTDGSLVVDSCDTSFNSSLSVRSISDILDPWNSDIRIDADDSSASCDLIAAEITFAVSVGDTYYIQLDGNGANDFGPAQLNWTFTIPV